MFSKKSFFLVLFFLIFIYTILSISFYFNFSNSLDEYNLKIYEDINTLQNLAKKVHDEDSQLYKTLLLKENLPKRELNNKSNIINDLFNINQNQLSSKLLISTIDEYYNLESSKQRIIELHNLNQLSTTFNYDTEINDLLFNYEKQTNNILSNIKNQILMIREKNLIKKDELLFKFLIKEIILFIIFIITILFVLFNSSYLTKSKEKKISNSILDEDMREILNYVRKEILKGNFPTFKEVKFHLKISHPTLLLKLKHLENKKLLCIKKKGRNKYLYLN